MHMKHDSENRTGHPAPLSSRRQFIRMAAAAGGAGILSAGVQISARGSATKFLQIEGVKSGRLDAGFVFSATGVDGDLAQRLVARYKTILAGPKGHPLTKRTKVRLRDLQDVPFAWMSRWVNPGYYDGLMHECFRGGLKSPRIVQEGVDQAMTLSLVACRIGFTFAADEARWQCPRGVTFLPVVDLNFPVPIYLIWRKDNQSPVLKKFLTQVEAL